MFRENYLFICNCEKCESEAGDADMTSEDDDEDMMSEDEDMN